MNTIKSLKGWTDPDAQYRVSPFFILNDDHSTDSARDRIRQMLEQFKELGYGGIYLHSREGLTTEYLSEQWFDLIEFCHTQAAKIGIKVYLYDENGYPSGFGGGHVAATHPEACVQYLAYRVLRDLPDPMSGETILSGHYIDTIEPLNIGKRLAENQLALWLQDQHPSLKVESVGEESIVVFYTKNMPPLPWFGDMPYVSLTDPLVTQTFIKTTHEKYAERFEKHFGKSIGAIFTDEPHLYTAGSGPSKNALHISPYIFSEFFAQHNYDLKDHLAELFFDYSDYKKVRFDYYETLHNLWLNNWAKPLEQWCKKKNIPLTGHYLEHDWPIPYVTPGHVHLLAHLDWPGTDMLFCNILEGEKPGWFTTQDAQPKGKEPHFTMYLKQCSSVCNQLQKQKNICECWGAGGNDSKPADYKRIGDWLVVNGVNMLIPHMSMTTIRGSRKMDHPQFFSDQSSWFSYIKPLNDYFARLCMLTSKGTVKNNILVLDPLTTGYTIAKRSQSNDKVFKSMDDSFCSLVDIMTDSLMDFDIGDEYVMEEFGDVTQNMLNIGNQSYNTIVWPAMMQNVRHQTVAILDAFLQAGGNILSLEKNRILVDGRNSNLISELQEDFSKQWEYVDSTTQLIEILSQKHPPSLELLSNKQISGIYHLRKILENGSRVHMLVNSSDTPKTLRATTQGQHILYLNTLNGTEETIPYTTDVSSKCVHFDINIESLESKIYYVSDLPVEYRNLPADDSRKIYSLKQTALPVEIKEITRLSDNRLVLDVCDLQVRGANKISDIRVQFANQYIWQKQGFANNQWFRHNQYRKQIIDRNDFDAYSGFISEFKFNIETLSDLSSLKLAVECPELYKIAVNGQEIVFNRTKTWLDPSIKIASVGDFAKSGLNMVSIVSQRFDVRMELDQIYLLGNFSLKPTDSGFCLCNPSKLELGSWRLQGMPFYDAAVDYKLAPFTIPKRAEKIVIELGEFNCSIVEVFINGTSQGIIGWYPYKMDITQVVKNIESNECDIKLRVVGTPKNLLGPFHDPNKQRKISGQWLNGKRFGPIPGNNYDIIDYGLLDNVKIYSH